MITTDPSVAKAEIRYPGCAIQIFKGNHTIVLNPAESQKFRILSFGLAKAKMVLRKIKQLEAFVRDPHAHQDGVEVFTYNKHQMVLLNPGDTNPRFQMGLDKANLVLLRRKAIENFVAIYGGKEACTEFNLTQPE